MLIIPVYLPGSPRITIVPSETMVSEDIVRSYEPTGSKAGMEADPEPALAQGAAAQPAERTSTQRAAGTGAIRFAATGKLTPLSQPM